GSHGTSHRFVSKHAAEFMGKKPEDVRIITCHLGNGSSLAAVAYGKCVDTSMGITPLEGMIMGTRSGVMDPAVVQYICNNDHISVDEMLNICNKKSGLLGISGLSNDMRDIEKATFVDNNPRAKLAWDMLIYEITKYIGSYIAGMNGVEAIVFTGGIGENTNRLREQVIDGLSWMGIAIDHAKNAAMKPGHAEDTDLTAEGSRVKILVIPTNEEIAIARDTLELVTK
ncbi:MAG: acetate kinase, partial [Clostridia bacterium]|nr:acetate kinase [Clostridia bacterium]